jgi:3-oxoadipate enol-lactonase
MLPRQRLAPDPQQGADIEDGSGWRTVELPGRGTTHAYDRPHPSSAAPTVLLLHGWTATGSLNWSATMLKLAESYRVVALDHRGHGRGIRGHDPFTLEDCADDAVALMDVLGVRRAIVVGYSMGGPIAQLMWRRNRDRVCGLVLCATAADFTPRIDVGPLAGALQHLHEVTSLVPATVRRHLARPLVASVLTDREVRDGVLDAMSQHVELSIREAGSAIGRFRSTSWIGEIDVPVVVVLTSRDRLVPPDRQRHLASSIPGAHTLPLDAGHLVAFTRPELLARAVVSACSHITERSPGTRRRRFARAINRMLQPRRRRRPASPRSRWRRRAG